MPIFSPDRHAHVPSYVKLTKQPIAGGIYRPLANDEDSNACAPSALSGHHSSKLYTQKSAIHAISDNTSIFISGAGTLPCLLEMVSSGSVSKAEIDNNEQIASSELQPHQPAEQPLNQVVSVCKRAAHATAKTLSTAGHTAVKATKVTGHAIHTAATAVKNAWHTFINFKAVQLIIKFFRKAYGPWKKRMRFSYAFYAIVFTLLTSAEVILQKDRQPYISVRFPAKLSMYYRDTVSSPRYTFVPTPISDSMRMVCESFSMIWRHRYSPMPVDRLSARPLQPV